MKIHNKIIYLVVSIFLIYTFLFGGFIYYSIANYAYTDFYKRLEIRAVTAAKIKLEHPTEVSSIKELHQEYLEKLPHQKEYFFEVNEMGAIDSELVPLEIRGAFIKEVIQQGSAIHNHQNLFYSGIHYVSTENKEYVVVISAENYFNSHHIAYLKNLLFTSLIYTIILIPIISVVFSRTLVHPINNIIKEVKKISSENLHLRLMMPNQNDSLSRLTMTFNDMLDRLETSFETQKNFISNASHELNTPLTSIIGQADVALTKLRTSDEYIETIKIILGEAEKLEQKTKALLFMAQTGYNGKSLKFEIVRTDQLVLDAKQTVEKIDRDSKVCLDFSLLPEIPEKLKINGNGQLLHLALCNIMLNAFKYSDGQPINVALGVNGKKVIIIIKDKGIGIPEDEIKYIYDPFFRASNTKNYEGYGIGLPLARNIIKIHNGQLNVQSVQNEGTTVRIDLPIFNGKF
ncbi:HAMP domain-containing sensor histidine kinase [Reichenbachiella sp. MALMAid0571]|uniref:sensor histidine kinase n=1 Tax=Reichenbachiella sp. MALMAid0571 TaxID=3143939 RepID=UPI0032DF2738